MLGKSHYINYFTTVGFVFHLQDFDLSAECLSLLLCMASTFNKVAEE